MKRLETQKDGDIRNSFRLVCRKPAPTEDQSDNDNIDLNTSKYFSARSKSATASQNKKITESASKTSYRDQALDMAPLSGRTDGRLGMQTSKGMTSNQGGTTLEDARLSRLPTKRDIIIHLDSDDEDFPAPKTLDGTPAAVKVANVSFGSMSELSEPPPSSQLSQPVSHSKRLSNDGQDKVRNSSSNAKFLDAPIQNELSDSDSDPDDDITTMIAQKTQALQTRAASLSTDADERKDDGYDLRDRQPKRVKRDSGPQTQYPTPPGTTSKYSLAAILEKTRKAEEVERKVQKIVARINEDTEKRAAQEKCMEEDDMPAVSSMDFENKFDLADPARAKRALQRSNALEGQVNFRFFDTVLEEDQSRRPFPHVGQDWQDMLYEETSREEAVVSGIVTDLCKLKPLPAEIQEWMLGEILFEEREHISLAYVYTLAACATHEKTSSLMDLPALRDSMERLGAREEIIYELPTFDDEPAGQPKQRVKAGRRGLASFLLLLSMIREKLPPTVTEASLYYVSLILLDVDVAQHAHLMTRAIQTLSDLCERLPVPSMEHVSRRLATRLLKRLTQPIRFSELLTLWPCLSPEAALLRRQLAFFAATGHFPTQDEFGSVTTWKHVQTALKGPKFNPSGHVDYSNMKAYVVMLDYAIGNGFSDFGFLPDMSIPSAAPEETVQASKNRKAAAFFDKYIKPAAPSPEKQAYNDAVQITIKLAEDVGRKIRTGTGEVRMIKCKGALETLTYRLKHAVRTTKEPSSGVFS